MNTQTLINGLHAIKLQASSVSVVNDTLKTDRVTLSKAHSLISENKEAVKMVLAYCRYTDISVPDVDEKPFLQWCEQRQAYIKKAAAQMTKHKEDCKRVFNRYDNSCLRCKELMNGAEPRKAWGWRKKRDEANRLAEIKSHNCIKNNCGIVCTAFDW